MNTYKRKRYTKEKNTYIRKSCNVFIDIIYIAILVGIGYGIYNLIRCIFQKFSEMDNVYGSLISATVTIVLAFISYVIQLRKYLLIWLQIFKQKIYQFVSCMHTPFSSCAITNYNPNNLFETNEQSNFIESAICILKNSEQNMILISGFAGGGKTTSVMLLLNAIASDKDLYDIFSELQKGIIYFDGVNDKAALVDYLQRARKQKDKLIIIDNMQKYTISFINEIMDRVKNLILQTQSTNNKLLIIFLYQETERNNALYNYIKDRFFSQNNNIFNLKSYINFEESILREHFKQEKELIGHICEIDNSFFQQYMKNIVLNRKNNSIVILLNDFVFNEENTISRQNKKKIFVLIIAIFAGMYNGYVTKKELHQLWKKKYSPFSLLQENLIIRYYVRNRVLTPFPFMHCAYIFNEDLAKEYRKRLIHNEYYKEESCIIAKKMFLHCKENMPQKWLFFLLCSSSFCKDFSQNERITYFENTLSAYHLQYILDLVETEISIVPEKKEIFRQELGIIYIYNGNWLEAKKILYTYVESHDINKDIWHIQLKIIEAEHGGSDDEYLDMLNCMESECTNSSILFQINYWREHICMEHGTFSLNAWETLLQELISNPQLEKLKKDEHFATRIVADYERTYFLKGEIKYSRYKNIISGYTYLNKNIGYHSQLLELELSRAYYIQYDILYQLGIWGCIQYNDIDQNIIPKPDLIQNNSMQELLKEALAQYDFCIQKFQSDGKKKYRTLKVRKAELMLCTDADQYIEILNQYNQFEKYAEDNNITVFEGYCKTQKGKAFALYAYYALRRNDIYRFEQYLKEAEDNLNQAQNIYKKWGNTYGEFRAEFLKTLVHIIQHRNNSEVVRINLDNYRNNFQNELTNLNKKYNPQGNYVREKKLIEYLKNNITAMDIVFRILKFYPIILQ